MSETEGLTEQDRQNLVAFLDGELEEATAQALEAKLSRSTIARQEAEALQRTWEMLDYLPRPKAPEDFTHRTVERLKPPAPSLVRRVLRQPRFLHGSWAASAVAAGVLGFLIAYHWPPPPALQPSPEDIRLLQHRRYLERIDNLDFLKELGRPDLFGGDS